MSRESGDDARLTIRWTIGDVHARGFEMLRLSIACAFRMFGGSAKYVVCVNSISTEDARRWTGAVPVEVAWRQVTRADLPEVLAPYVDSGVIEGMGWKLAPLRVSQTGYELALDNDCVIWEQPEGMRQWLGSADGCLFAEDVERCLGSFDLLCPPGCLNAGIRGLPPDVDLQAELRGALEDAERVSGVGAGLLSEIEEQGLQAAAICRRPLLFLVKTAEVSICSPFWPRSPELGTCGAHFTGMNSRHLAWDYYDRPADEWLEEHWRRHRPALYEKAGLSAG